MILITNVGVGFGAVIAKRIEIMPTTQALAGLSVKKIIG